MTIKEAIKTITNFCDYIIPCDEYVYLIKGELVEAHTMAARALQEQKWIPVTERLPDEYQRVLVNLESKVQVVARIKDNCWVISWNNSLCPNVTHWMPLPEPPKEV